MTVDSRGVRAPLGARAVVLPRHGVVAARALQHSATPVTTADQREVVVKTPCAPAVACQTRLARG